MKKICIVMYVFGDTYQEYIPLFLLSLFKVYPDYGVRIYLDRPLSEKVSGGVEMFADRDVTIIQSYEDGLKLTKKARSFDQIGKSVRWLVYDKAFEDYEAVYIGDIDILFFAEKNPMFEEHIRHCDFLKKPYSNIAREQKLNKKLAPKPVARNFVKFGVGQTLRFYADGKKTITKMSGLHFMKTKEYFPKMLKLRENVVKELNLLAEGKSKKYNLCSFNNESLLYDMMLECGFGEIGKSKPGYNTATEGNILGYRPHHGIHLGIFRHKGIMESEKDTLKSEEYHEFYKSFEELAKTEEYKQLSKSFSEYLNEIIQNMREYYEIN